MYGDMFTRLIDYFAIHTNIESLCCTAGTNRMFYVNSTSKKKKKEKDTDQLKYMQQCG